MAYDAAAAADTQLMNKEALIAQFAETYPIDEIAKAKLRALPEDAISRVMVDFRPAPDGSGDHSRRLMGFLKGFSYGGLGTTSALARTPSSTPVVAFNPALGVPSQALANPSISAILGAAQQQGLQEQTAAQGFPQLVTPEQLELFRARYPMDDNAFEYLKISPQEVQERVINTFRPPETALQQSDFSKIVTSHITFCTRAHKDDAWQHPSSAHSNVSVEEACNAIMGRYDGAGSLLDRSIPDEKLDMFRNTYPMDDRAFDYLKSAPADVQERVLSTFRVESVQADYSRAVTAHVRFCLKRHREVAGAPTPLPSGVDGATTMALIADFKVRYPMDERALNYLLQSSVEVKSRVLAEFRPASGIEGDFSRAVTAYVRRCREEENRRQPWGGGYGYGGSSSSSYGDGGYAESYDTAGYGYGGGRGGGGGGGYAAPSHAAAAPAARGGAAAASSSSSASALLGAMGLTPAQQAQAQALLENAMQTASAGESLTKKLRTHTGRGVQPVFGSAGHTGAPVRLRPHGLPLA